MFNTAIYDDMNERFRREDDQPITVVRYICRHIFTDGRRCGSVCLRNEQFCYYHHTSRRPAQPKQRKRRSSTFNLPLIEDRASIQTSIAEVLRLIAANNLDPRRAGLLLYGLQIASSNMPRHASSRNSEPETPAEQVEQVILDPEIGPVAPPAIYQTAEEKRQNKSFARKLLDEIAELERINDKEYYRSEMEDAELRIADANQRADQATQQVEELKVKLNETYALIGVCNQQHTQEIEALKAQSTLPKIQAVASDEISELPRIPTTEASSRPTQKTSSRPSPGCVISTEAVRQRGAVERPPAFRRCRGLSSSSQTLSSFPAPTLSSFDEVGGSAFAPPRKKASARPSPGCVISTGAVRPRGAEERPPYFVRIEPTGRAFSPRFHLAPRPWAAPKAGISRDFDP